MPKQSPFMKEVRLREIIKNLLSYKALPKGIEKTNSINNHKLMFEKLVYKMESIPHQQDKIFSEILETYKTKKRFIWTPYDKWVYS